MRCYYCDKISAADERHGERDAAFDTGSEAPRCPWHWRFFCDHCGEAGHFMMRFYCPRTGRLLCSSAGEAQIVEGTFWAWTYWWALLCPDCGDLHAGLDRAEALGNHPWQRDPFAATTRRWLSDERELVRYPSPPLPTPPVNPTDADADANWSANADAWDAGYDERGDQNRRESSDPVLLVFLGDVAGQRVLDAGSGNGYLSRLLAKRGAWPVAVENAHRFHELALAYQTREPLPIEFHRASLSSMPFLTGASIDVADYAGAIAEIGRVLKPAAASSARSRTNRRTFAGICQPWIRRVRRTVPPGRTTTTSCASPAIRNGVCFNRSSASIARCGIMSPPPGTPALPSGISRSRKWRKRRSAPPYRTCCASIRRASD